MTLLEKMQTAIPAAMRAKDELGLNTLRSIKTALDRYTKDQRKPLDEKAEQAILKTLAKQRNEAAEAFTKGIRPELAAKELAELALIEAFMPQFATEEEVDAAVQKTILDTGASTPGQAGSVIKGVQTLLAGKRVDNKTLMEKIKADILQRQAELHNAGTPGVV